MKKFSTLTAVATALQNGDLSAVELCHEVFSNIKKLNPVIHAYSDVLAETAEAEARASDQRRAQGETKGTLDGIPIAVKDIIDTTPAVCAAGLEHLSDYRPTQDADSVRLLRDAGAVITGVTETDRGAFGTTTLKVTNPLEPSRVVGGSSGGSGAVIAADMAFAALGTDTGGSIRIPSACCSVAGFKPTWGRVSTKGVMPLASSLDHVGPLARCVEDLQLVQAVLDPKLNDTQGSLADNLTIGIAEDYYADADDIIKLALDDVFNKLKAEKVNLSKVKIPTPHDIMSFDIIHAAKEIADYHTKAFPDIWPSYSELPRTTIELGLQCSDQDYQAAEKKRQHARATVDQALKEVDAIILPTLPTDAPFRDAEVISLGGSEVSVLEATLHYTCAFNQTGHPVVSIPAYIMQDGRSVNIQIVGAKDSDARLLDLARKIESLLAVTVDYQSIIDRHL